MIRCFVILMFILSALNLFGSQSPVYIQSNFSSFPDSAASDTAIRENRKLTAVLLTVTLGMLGVHRLYLGTKPWVPAVYLLTFGGGFFILPLIDLIAILSNKDLGKFENNSRIFMWINPDRPDQTNSP